MVELKESRFLDIVLGCTIIFGLLLFEWNLHKNNGGFDARNRLHALSNRENASLIQGTSWMY